MNIIPKTKKKINKVVNKVDVKLPLISARKPIKSIINAPAIPKIPILDPPIIYIK